MEAMAGLQDMFKQILREEVSKTLRQPQPHRVNEFWTDPTSGQFSMSRLCFGLLILGILLLDFTASLLWFLGKLEKEVVPHICTMNTAALISVASVYGFNSVMGAAGGLKEKVQSLLGRVGIGAPELPAPVDFPDE